tara:strand:+ start:837 stop:965 length:129 start_codon:yes stop_codon:yes gene_type:complete
MVVNKLAHSRGRAGARVVNGVVCKTIIHRFESDPALKIKGNI